MVKNSSNLFMLLFLGLLVAWFTFGKAKMDRRMRTVVPPMLQTIPELVDLNDDLIIDNDELRLLPLQLLKYDANADGELSKTELWGDKTPTSDFANYFFYTSLDNDENGALSQDELKNINEIFNTIDQDKNNQWNRKELDFLNPPN